MKRRAPTYTLVARVPKPVADYVRERAAANERSISGEVRHIMAAYLRYKDDGRERVRRELLERVAKMRDEITLLDVAPVDVQVVLDLVGIVFGEQLD